MKLTQAVNSLQAYKLQGRTVFAGMPISIENKKGSTRKGVDANGKPWSIVMPFDYGYIGKTKGPDGDAYDCFVGPSANAQYAYVVHQCQQKNRNKWDEDKVMLGFDSADAAVRAYRSAYNNVDLFHSMSVLPMDVFKKKVMKTKDKVRHGKIHAGGPGSGRHVTVYHGTSLDKWKKIQKEGLKVGQPNSEVGKVISPGQLFLTPSKAYAQSTARSYKNIGKEPVLLEIQLPARIKQYRVRAVPDEFKVGNFSIKENIPANLIKRIEAMLYEDGGIDYRQFREGTPIQPITNNHPPSLKNPMKVPVDNPDSSEDKYKDQKKRRSKRTRKQYMDLARHQSGKPEMAQTTIFVPLPQG